jgi:hypothetical protein
LASFGAPSPQGFAKTLRPGLANHAPLGLKSRQQRNIKTRNQGRLGARVAPVAIPMATGAAQPKEVEVCHLGNIAARLGRKVQWDPSAEQILNDEEAAKMLSRPYRKPWALG